MIRRLIVLGFLVVACTCKETTPEPAVPTTGRAIAVSRCSTQTDELRTFLSAVLDPAHHVAAPWPTGDAAFDAELPAMRDRVRDQAKPADPARRQAPLTEGIKPGRLEKELTTCPLAIRQLEKVGEASPDKRIATFVGLADAIAACECRTSIPRVKALVYLLLRGPE